jgi:hypothetical protein
MQYWQPDTMPETGDLRGTMVVLCFGSRGLPGDALALELGESLDLPGVTFASCSSPENIVDYLDQDLYVMDVAKGVSEVTLVTDLSQFEPPPAVTAHDLDPGVFVRLVERLYGVSVPVIALPMGVDVDVVKGQLLKLIATLRAGSARRRRSKGRMP